MPGAEALVAPAWVPWDAAGPARRPRRRRPPARPGGRRRGSCPRYVASDDPAVEERRAGGRPGPRSGCCRARAASGRRAVAGRPARAALRHGPLRPGALRHLRVLPAARRCAARGVRGVRQRVLARRRGGRRGRSSAAGRTRTSASSGHPGGGRRAGVRRRRRPGACGIASGVSVARPVRHRGAARRRPRRLGRLAHPLPGGRERRGGPAPRRLRRHVVRRAGPERGRRGAGGRGSRAGADRGSAPDRWARRAAGGEHRRAADAAGVAALASLRASAKRDDAGSVGRFGVGFAAVLAVSDAPRVVTRRGGVAFSAASTAEAVRELSGPAAELARRDGQLPVLRLVWPTGADEPPPPAGFATEVRLPLRPGVDPDALLAHARAAAPDLLLALPDLVEIDVDGRRFGATALPEGREARRSSTIGRAGGRGVWFAGPGHRGGCRRHRRRAARPARAVVVLGAAARRRRPPARSATTSCTRRPPPPNGSACPPG